MPRPGHATLATTPDPWGAALAAVVYYFVVLPVSKLTVQSAACRRHVRVPVLLEQDCR